MALGDSITQCKTPTACYRRHLHRMFVARGLHAQWVGTMSGLYESVGGDAVRKPVSAGTPATVSDWPLAAQSHEGHWGWTAHQLIVGHERQPQRSKFAGWLRQLERTHMLPDVVLLHIGTNDLTKYVVRQGAPVRSVVASVYRLLARSCAHRPQVRVIVACPIPYCRGNASLLAHRRVLEHEYCMRLRKLVVRGVNTCPSMRLVLANMSRQVACRHLSRDGVHPAASGARAIASMWFEILIARHWVV